MNTNEYNSETYNSAYAQKKEEFIQFYNKQNEKDNSSVDEKYKKILEVK